MRANDNSTCTMREISPLVFCSSAQDWVPVPDARSPLAKGQGSGECARVSTLNILADCFPWVVELAIASKLRSEWLTQELRRLDASVLCFNEATLSAIEHVMADAFVRENYYVSEWGDSAAKCSINGTLLRQHGCFVLSKVPIESLSAFSWGSAHTKSSREVIIARVMLCGVSTVLCATHTTAYQHHHKQREQQMTELKQHVEADAKYSDAKAFFILGDLNLHCTCEDGVILRNDMLDLWAETHFADIAPFNDHDPGFTFDSDTNHIIPRYIPGETRRMRLDRILMRKNSMLKPRAACAIWANHAVDPTHPEVFPSDHYGLTIDVERSEEPVAGSETVAALLKTNAAEPPVRHKRTLYANTVGMGVHCAWLLGRYVGFV